MTAQGYEFYLQMLVEYLGMDVAGKIRSHVESVFIYNRFNW